MLYRIKRVVSLLMIISIISLSGINIESYAGTTNEISVSNEQNYFYRTDEQGNVRISVGPAELILGQNEINKGPDGCYYNLENIQLNTLKVIGDKYYNQYEQLTDVELMKFDSYNELIAFILYLQHYKSNTQGTTVYLTTMTQIKKSELRKLESSDSEIYKSKVTQLAYQINRSLSVEEQLRQVDQIVKDSLSFDWTRHSATYTMDQALEAGYGVCYHQAKLMNDILSELGITSELIYGTWIDTQNGKESAISHTWLRVYDGTKWIYLDTSLAGSGLLDYEFYIEHYRMYQIQQ